VATTDESSIDGYIHGRLDEQINWYSFKGRENKRNFTRLQIIVIITGAAIPLINIIDFLPISTRLASALLGALIAIVTSILGLYKYEENWYHYRKTAESLKKERYLFLFDAGEYFGKQNEEKNRLLVQKIETLVSEDTREQKKST
jgi:uncharacterized membrane protein YgaE (UPF0421/DUF939 family)